MEVKSRLTMHCLTHESPHYNTNGFKSGVRLNKIINDQSPDRLVPNSSLG